MIICLVSFAVAQYGNSRDGVAAWKIAMESVLQIIDTILDHPTDPKFYSINSSNEIFSKK